jgi:hypothetical protein
MQIAVRQDSRKDDTLQGRCLNIYCAKQKYCIESFFPLFSFVVILAAINNIIKQITAFYKYFSQLN